MNNPFYLIISFIIGASILLILIRVNVFITESNQVAMHEEIVLREFINVQQIIEYYLKKVGYGVNTYPIIEADSSRIKFLCDDDSDNIVDEIEFKLGPAADNTINPSDYKLLLIRNGVENIISASGVTKFKMEYLDINGNPTTEKILIKSVIVSLRIETGYPIDNVYIFLEQKFFVKPKNIA